MKPIHILIIASLVVTTQFSTLAFAAKGGKPPPQPVVAEDVDCTGCVDTADIASGAVNTDKLSAEFLQLINQLEARVTALVNPQQPPDREFIDNGNGTVTDTGTGLMWEMKDASDSVEDYDNPHDVENRYTWTTLDDGDDTAQTGQFFLTS